jgi:REP element-mobilizing transposase RayT
MPPYSGWNSNGIRGEDIVSSNPNDTPPPQRKRPRLKADQVYQRPGAVGHIVIGTKERCPVFNDEGFAEAFKTITVKTSKETHCPLYAFCIMPDHVHLLVGASESTGIIDFVKRVKGRFSVACRNMGRAGLLQKSFYDHMIRKDEDLRKAAEYILANPVRKGLAERIGQYSFAGSLVFDLDGGM